MLANMLKQLISEGGLKKYDFLYEDIKLQTERFINAIDAFSAKYGENRDVEIFSVPGRSEIIGNHTDHNRGRVMAGAINRDIIAVVSKNNDGAIRFSSQGYPEDTVNISDISSTDNFRKFTSRSLVAGLAQGFVNKCYKVGGFDAYSTTEVLKGSGLSSSAAFEVMVGNILNHLYNEGGVDNKEIAKISQYSENVYFGKPCGLMDQMACAVGGFVYIDFEKSDEPKVEKIDFSLSEAGYTLCIVNTGGNHANLNEDYASVPAEMKAAAQCLGADALRDFSERDIISNISKMRETVGDRAILRAIHFVRENERVTVAKESLASKDIEAFLDIICASGNSSFKYLQNVYTNKNVEEQRLSLALALTDGYLAGKMGAHRVHGGGFAGTIQAFVKKEELNGYKALMDSVFGNGAATPLNIRPLGAIKLF